MKFSTFATIAIALSLTAAPRPVLAQQNLLTSPVTVDVQDAPVRRTLEVIFQQAGIKNYVIDNNVVGFVTLKLTDQPLDNTIKLLMRANSTPLTYTIENGVWIVKPRSVSNTPAPQLPVEEPVQPQSTTARYERINLTYLDPADLAQLLGGIMYVPSFSRQMGGQGVSSGNGLIGNPGGNFTQGFGQPGFGQQGIGRGLGLNSLNTGTGVGGQGLGNGPRLGG